MVLAVVHLVVDAFAARLIPIASDLASPAFKTRLIDLHFAIMEGNDQPRWHWAMVIHGLLVDGG
jgi:hypothetical protein